MRKGVNKTFGKYDDFDPDYFLDWFSYYKIYINFKLKLYKFHI